MRLHQLIASLLVANTKALIAPAPIQWAELHRRFVLAPKAALPAERLMIWRQNDKMLKNTAPDVTLRPDRTIALGSTPLCFEASGLKSGDEVRVNYCSGAPSQLWDFRPVGHGRKNQIELKDTGMCIDVNDEGGLDGAPVELRECEDVVTQSWKVHGPVPFPGHGPLHTPALSSSTRNAMAGLGILGMIGLLSVSVWLISFRRRLGKEAMMEHSLPFTKDQGGISLTPRGESARSARYSAMVPHSPSFNENMVPAVIVLATQPPEQIQNTSQRRWVPRVGPLREWLLEKIRSRLHFEVKTIEAHKAEVMAQTKMQSQLADLIQAQANMMEALAEQKEATRLVTKKVVEMESTLERKTREVREAREEAETRFKAFADERRKTQILEAKVTKLTNQVEAGEFKLSKSLKEVQTVQAQKTSLELRFASEKKQLESEKQELELRFASEKLQLELECQELESRLERIPAWVRSMAGNDNDVRSPSPTPVVASSPVSSPVVPSKAPTVAASRLPVTPSRAVAMRASSPVSSQVVTSRDSRLEAAPTPSPPAQRLQEVQQRLRHQRQQAEGSEFSTPINAINAQQASARAPVAAPRPAVASSPVSSSMVKAAPTGSPRAPSRVPSIKAIAPNEKNQMFAYPPPDVEAHAKAGSAPGIRRPRILPPN